MSSRRHREHTSSSRKDRYRPRSPGENDPDRARQSVSAAQRYAVDPTSTAHDRLHRSVRRHDVADALASLHTKSAAKDPSTHQQPITSQHILTQSQNQSLHPVVPLTVSTQPHLPSSRQPAQDTQRDAYSIRTKKSEKRSPPSSDEKILVGDQTKPSRSTQQPRTGYPVPDGAVSAPATTQAFWIPPAPSARDATSSSKRREKEKGREKEKERKEREREKSRQREEQRMKDRADEAVRERELRREEEERARDRRRKERGRSERRATDLSKDPESRRRDESQGVDPSAPRSSQFPSISRARAKHFTLDERVLVSPSFSFTLLTTHGRSKSRPQDPSGPPTPSIVPVQHSAVSAQNYVSSRVPVSSAPRREDYPPTSRVPQSTPADHDKRRHRSNRDRTGGHQSAQESGMSSSEQEHSGRERSLVRHPLLESSRSDSSFSVHPIGGISHATTSLTLIIPGRPVVRMSEHPPGVGCVWFSTFVSHVLNSICSASIVELIHTQVTQPRSRGQRRLQLWN